MFGVVLFSIVISFGEIEEEEDVNEDSNQLLM